MTTVITNCTARKKVIGETLKLRPSLLGESLQETIDRWHVELRKNTCRKRAVDVYQGRSVRDARRATQLSSGALYFVSAGLGLVSSSDEISAYDLTPSDPDGGLALALCRHGVSVADWWSCLSGNVLSTTVRAQEDELFLIALPSTYLEMVRKDLGELQSQETNRIRILTSKAGASVVPQALHRVVMPYDDRLESIPGFSGTRADFPQRALLHFVEMLSGQHIGVEDSTSRVREALASYGERNFPSRRRADDDEIKRLIRHRWVECKGQSARLLRALRDGEAVACEQGRFARLWREVDSAMLKVH